MTELKSNPLWQLRVSLIPTSGKEKRMENCLSIKRAAGGKIKNYCLVPRESSIVYLLLRDNDFIFFIFSQIF